MTDSSFESLADSLLAALEEGIGAHGDAELQGGILTVEGDAKSGGGTWVINKQLALLSLLVAAGTVLAFGACLRALIDRGFAEGRPDVLNYALASLLAVALVLAIASGARFYLVSWLGERVVGDLRRDLFAHVIRLGPAWFEVKRSGDVMSRISADAQLIEQVIGSSADMVSEGGETLDAVRTVQAFAQEDRAAMRFGEATERTFAAARRRIARRAIMTTLVIFIVFAAVGFLLWMGGHDVISGRISAGDLTAFVFYAVLVATSGGAISETIGDLQRAAGAAERLAELGAEPPAIVEAVHPKLLPKPVQGSVRFEEVSFRYPTRPDSLALDRFELGVAPGETVAIVGPSGAGKTTVFNLLLRFYDPESGTIRIDGVDIRDLSFASLRGTLAIVPQEPVLFTASVTENIRYGRPDASEAAVHAAADAASALAFIEALPQGFATDLGARGVRLSGGQRQRIAIARALLCDPAILLLDEATSALDAESELAVQQALDRLMHKRTTLVIAHRLATVQKADRIVVIDHGRVVDVGRHSDLVRRDGLYARLAELQFNLAAAAS